VQPVVIVAAVFSYSVTDLFKHILELWGKLGSALFTWG